MPFYPITPCRQYISLGSPLATGVDRTITRTGAPCGIPVGTIAVSANLTIFNITGASGNGTLKLGIAAAPTTSWINYPATETQRANAGAVTLSAAGTIVVQPAQGSGSIDLIVDVNGYYLSASVSMPASNQFGILGNYSGNPVILGTNTNTNALSTGVYGLSTSTGGGGIGVRGQQNGSGWGVYGFTPSGFGVYGSTTTGTGVYADTGGAGDGATAMYAANNGGGTNYTFGLKAVTTSTGLDAAGIKGIGGYGDPLGDATDCSPCYNSGVRGVNDNPSTINAYGVWGISRRRGTGGTALAVSGAGAQATGVLGYYDGTSYFGVFALGNYGGTGAKFFIEPHATDATKVIRYIALEGPEAGTYFRGTARFLHGRAVIEVPETFRMVTQDEGMTVQLTAVGAAANLYIESQDLNTIVVRSSKDVAFHYQVNGVRHGYGDFEPVVSSGIFTPERADPKMPPYLTEAQKACLVSNGTYKRDGTVNLETAKALHWDAAWEADRTDAPAAKAVPSPARQQ